MRTGRFKVLVRHFFARFFDNETVAQHGDMQTGVIQLLALLAVPGWFLCFYMWRHYSPVDPNPFQSWDAVSDRYLFVTYSMFVLGIVTLLEWDALFPDRRDYLILTSLPISIWQMFSAKAAAVAMFVALFAIDVNVLSTVMLPLVSIGASSKGGVGLLELIQGHAVATAAGGAFSALLFASLQGVLINVVPSRLIARVSAVLQALSITVLVMAMLLYPLVSAMLKPLITVQHPAIFVLPPFWFLGMYQELQPGGSLPVYSELAAIGWMALGVVFVLFVATYAAGYARHSRNILAGAAYTPSGPGRTAMFLRRVLHRLVLRHPHERATFHFILQTLTRSSRHRVLLAAAIGTGTALCILTVVRISIDGVIVTASINWRNVPAAPMILVFTALTAVRAAFTMPVELRANWVFRMAPTRSAAHHRAGVRWWVLFFGALPIAVMLVPGAVNWWGWAEGLFRVAFVTLCAMLLIEALFATFRAIPFTCASLPGKVQVAILAAGYVLGVTFYGYSLAGWQDWFADSAWRWLIFGGLAYAGLRAFEWLRTRADWDRMPVLYEPEGDEILLLNIG